MPTYPTFGGKTPLTKEVMNDLVAQARKGSRHAAGTGLTLSDLGSLGASYAPDRGRVGVGIWALLTGRTQFLSDPSDSTVLTNAYSWKEVIRNPDGTRSDHPAPLTGSLFDEPAMERMNREVNLLEPVFIRRYVLDIKETEDYYPYWLLDANGEVKPVYWLFDSNFHAEWIGVTDVKITTTYYSQTDDFSWRQVNMPGGDPVPGGDGPAYSIALPVDYVLDPGDYLARQCPNGLVETGSSTTAVQFFYGAPRDVYRTDQFTLPWVSVRDRYGNEIAGSGIQTPPDGDPFYQAHPFLRASRDNVGWVTIAPFTLTRFAQLLYFTVTLTALIDLSGIDVTAFPLVVPLNLIYLAAVNEVRSSQDVLSVELDTQPVYSPRPVRLGGSYSFLGSEIIARGGWEIMTPAVGLGSLWSVIVGFYRVPIAVPSSSGTITIKYSYSTSY